MNKLKILKFALLVCFAAAGWFFGGLKTRAATVFPPFAPLAEGAIAVSSAADSGKILDLVNSQRRRRGLGDLFWSRELETLARNYSRQMANEKFFGHYDKNGDSVVQRAKSMSIKGWRKIGENLFMCGGYADANGLAVDRWMKSPLHRKNILDERFNTTGIGIYESRDGRLYVTQVFAEY